jgi:hypothetical protein
MVPERGFTHCLPTQRTNFFRRSTSKQSLTFDNFSLDQSEFILEDFEKHFFYN